MRVFNQNLKIELADDVAVKPKTGRTQKNEFLYNSVLKSAMAIKTCTDLLIIMKNKLRK